MKERHASEGLGVDQMFGLGPASSAHHLLADHHNAAFEGAAGLHLTRDTFKYTMYASLTTATKYETAQFYEQHMHNMHYE